MNPDDLLPENVANPTVIDFPWSIFQEDIFAAVEASQRNLSIEAVAGSGKSTTLVQAMKLCMGDSLFLAFNKSIAVALGAKMPPGATAKTFNALGHKMLTSRLYSKGIKPNLNAYKLWDLGRQIMNEKAWEEYGKDVVKLVQLGKHKAVGIYEPIDQTSFQPFIGDYAIEIDSDVEDAVCGLAAILFKKSLEEFDPFDFDDQVYMPVYWEQNFPMYDTVFVDEAQDLSPIQHIMLQRLADRGARIIAVGDSRQAIYGFRGADTKSMSRMAEMFDMQLLPLSICYRCPKEVVGLAQRIVPQIEADVNAKIGKVTYLDEFPEPAEYPSDAMVVCRLNAPLFELALTFLKEKLPCQLRSSFGKELIKFVKSFPVKSTEELYDALKAWKDKEVAAAEARGWHGKAAIIQDKYESLVPFTQEFSWKVEVVAALNALLSDGFGPILSSIHKAKGLEAPHVYILRPDLLPHPRARDQAQLEQEMNLKYVAITRALETLTFLPEES